MQRKGLCSVGGKSSILKISTEFEVIYSTNGPDNLQELISMEKGSGVGRVFDEREFPHHLGFE
jgi:hypothetical protein